MAEAKWTSKVGERLCPDGAEYLPAIEAGRVALFGDHKPADTLVGVETLAHPGCLIEVEAIAVTGT